MCVNSGKYSYKGLVKESAHPVFVEYPRDKLRKFYYKLWPVSIIKELERLRHETQPDVVHFLTGDFTLSNYICLHPSPGYYYTVHDLHPHELNVKNPIRRLFHRYIISGYERMHLHIDNLTTSSLTQTDELKRLYPAKNIKFTHFPTLVTDKIAHGNRNVKELDGIDRYILFFGNVEVYKGVDLLVEAFKRSGVDEKCKLVIAGRGYLKIQPDDDIVRIDRFIYDEELGDLFRRAALVVYPYRSATMSGVLSLAYYFNKEVLLSDIPYFKENGCELTTFFKNADIDDLAAKLEACLQKSSGKIKTNCYERIYSSPVLTDDYRAFYKNNDTL